MPCIYLKLEQPKMLDVTMAFILRLMVKPFALFIPLIVVLDFKRTLFCLWFLVLWNPILFWFLMSLNLILFMVLDVVNHGLFWFLML